MGDYEIMRSYEEKMATAIAQVFEGNVFHTTTDGSRNNVEIHALHEGLEFHVVIRIRAPKSVSYYK